MTYFSDRFSHINNLDVNSRETNTHCYEDDMALQNVAAHLLSQKFYSLSLAPTILTHFGF